MSGSLRLVAMAAVVALTGCAGLPAYNGGYVGYTEYNYAPPYGGIPAYADYGRHPWGWPGGWHHRDWHHGGWRYWRGGGARRGGFGHPGFGGHGGHGGHGGGHR